MHRSTPSCAALVATLLLAVAAEARADFASGGTITEFLPGDFTDNTTPNPADVAAADGAFVFDKTAIFGGSFVDFEATYTSIQTDLTAILYTGSVTGAYLSAVSFINTQDGSSATWFGAAPADGSLAADAANRFVFDVTGAGTYGLSTFGAFSTYDHIATTFAFDNAGDRLALDAVANPEPGTLALFGLGAVGLGVVVRRRRARVVPKAG